MVCKFFKTTVRQSQTFGRTKEGHPYCNSSVVSPRIPRRRFRSPRPHPRQKPSSSACSINMAKAAITFAVLAFCAFVAEGQFSLYTPFFTAQPPTHRPKYNTGPHVFTSGRSAYISGTEAWNETAALELVNTFSNPSYPATLGIVFGCNTDSLDTSEWFCYPFGISNHGCHNIRKINEQFDEKVRSVATFGQCVHLFEHNGCRGQRITVGKGCYNVGCCPHSQLSKCNFANKMSSYMIC